MSSEEVVDAWLTLPRRIYLDTCTLQAIHNYGGVIWENEQFVPRDGHTRPRSSSRRSGHFG